LLKTGISIDKSINGPSSSVISKSDSNSRPFGPQNPKILHKSENVERSIAQNAPGVNTDKNKTTGFKPLVIHKNVSQ
jgi:hypothetical protein